MQTLQNVNMVLPEGIFFGNISFDGHIQNIEKKGAENKKCLRYVLPGVIDPHVHFRDPGFPNKETVVSGSSAAIAGGVTTIFDMPNTAPAVVNTEAFALKKSRYEKGAQCKWKIFVSATKKNFDFLESLHDDCIAGIKIYLGSSTGDLLLDEESLIRKTFTFIAKKNWILSIHAESEEILKQARKEFTGDMTDPASHSIIRPVRAATTSVAFCIELCRLTGARINICHASTSEEIDLIVEAKKEGLPITCEIAPHHLFFSEEDYKKLGTRIQMNPPLRSQKNVLKCWDHLQKGNIDMIATDHAPHTLEEKDLPFPTAPSGIPGIETSLPLMLSSYHENKITLNDLVLLMSSNVADLWNLNRGALEKGKEADILVLDFSKQWTVHNKNLRTHCAWSPWDGFSTAGKLEEVYINGVQVL
jgi:dihydroorotase